MSMWNVVKRQHKFAKPIYLLNKTQTHNEPTNLLR